MIILSATGDQTQIVLRSADMSSDLACILYVFKSSLDIAKNLFFLSFLPLTFCELFLCRLTLLANCNLNFGCVLQMYQSLECQQWNSDEQH